MINPTTEFRENVQKLNNCADISDYDEFYYQHKILSILNHVDLNDGMTTIASRGSAMHIW